MAVQGREVTGEYTAILVDNQGRLVIVTAAAAPVLADVIDRAGRLVGIVYGDQGQLLQVPGTLELITRDTGSTPTLMEEQRNVAYLTPADICAADLVPNVDIGTFRIYCCFDTAGDLYVRRDQGGVYTDEYLNRHENLIAESAYMFDIVVDENDDGINFRFDANATILKFAVVELSGMVG